MSSLHAGIVGGTSPRPCFATSARITRRGSLSAARAGQVIPTPPVLDNWLILRAGEYKRSSFSESWAKPHTFRASSLGGNSRWGWRLSMQVCSNLVRPCKVWEAFIHKDALRKASTLADLDRSSHAEERGAIVVLRPLNQVSSLTCGSSGELHLQTAATLALLLQCAIYFAPLGMTRTEQAQYRKNFFSHDVTTCLVLNVVPPVSSHEVFKIIC